VTASNFARLTLLRQPLNTNTVVVLAQNGQILFIRFFWTTERFRRACEFLYNLASRLKRMWAEKTKCWFWKNF